MRKDVTPGTDPYAHLMVYREGEVNHCPGCGQAQWYVGRITAECPFCGTALPLQHTGFEGMGIGAAFWDRDVFRHGWHTGRYPHSAAYEDAVWAPE